MVKRIFVVFIPLILLVSIYTYLNKKNDSQNTGAHLIVYTYSSFASSWGPGPEIKRLFEQKTKNTVEFIDVGEAGIIIQRILLEKNNPKADVVLGLDQFQLHDPSVQALFAELPSLYLNVDESLPIDKVQVQPFLAYNWAPMAFIYRKSDQNILPKKLIDFTSNEFKGKIILLDPRTSSPGYIFFNWVVQKLGEKETLVFFEKIKKNIYNITPSWSAGYGLFKKKQSQYIFSYLTSPTYHWVEEKNLDYEPLYLEDDLPYHIEYSAVLKSSANKELAQEFLRFLLESETQKIIMNKNYMLPVIAGARMGSEFEKLKKVKLFDSKTSMPRESVLKIWKAIRW